MKHVIALLLLALTSNSLAQPQPKEAKGTDSGGKTGMSIVARDKATWDKVKQMLGDAQPLTIGAKKGDGLKTLDGTDFKAQMIVAVFWGQMDFSEPGEKCWIEGVAVAKDEVVVDCRATLWGGHVLRSYRVWPYHAKVVPRSELPVRFTQTTEWTAAPGRSEKDKTMATIKSGEWKQNYPVEEPSRDATLTKKIGETMIPRYEKAEEIKAMPPCKATVVWGMGTCSARFKTTDGKEFNIGSPGAGPGVIEFLETVKEGQIYVFPSAFIDYLKTKQR